jgi:hypothetical protein
MDPYGAWDSRVRVCVYDDMKNEPVASSQPDNARDSFTLGLPSLGNMRLAGTGVAALKAGHRYTVFAQWDDLLGFGIAPRGTREVTLLVSASSTAPLTLAIPAATPVPPPSWAPRAHTAFGKCASCGYALPSDFVFVFGERFHRECAPRLWPWCRYCCS